MCHVLVCVVAAEYPAHTNYLYLSYHACEDDLAPEVRCTSVAVLGSGVYRIGSSVEFDYCAVGTVRELRRLGYKTIMINYNPETVSTDYDECDRLYFDELTFETVMDVYEREDPKGIILGMGGQIPNNLSMHLHRQGVRILGTSAEMIDNAENRYKFSRMCDVNGIDQPRWKELTSLEDARKFAEDVEYPVLLRPSYILSGTAMRVAHAAADLENDFATAMVVSRDYPVVMSKFVKEAREIEVDAVAKNGDIIVYAVSEHIENAGVHSGDASIVHPAQTLTPKQVEGVTFIARKIAKALDITGPFNIQFLGKGDEIKVIECNLRASRSFPFVSKTKGIDMISIATRAIMGLDVEVPRETKYDHVGVKVAMFSFNRLGGSDPTLSVDMMSTGEVACFGKTKEEAYLKAAQSSGIKIPKKNILLSIGSLERKKELLPAVRTLVAQGFTLFGTVGTADYYISKGIAVTPLQLPRSIADPIDLFDKIFANLKIELIINIPMRNKYRNTNTLSTTGYMLRRMAVDRGISLITDSKCAATFCEALRTVPRGPVVSKVDCQSSWTAVKLPGLAAFVQHSSGSLESALSTIEAQGFSSAVIATESTDRPINTAVDYAVVYSGKQFQDLTALAAQFSGVYFDLDVSHNVVAQCIPSIFDSD
jgi:carbamoyl-phosphate synthase large subunit